ncbi:MAG: hypothetical protein Hals2KO_33220 [Halioglobus sp.]
MKIRRFLEKDSRTAMARARTELGPDAVILSNKKVGGKVELVAAVDLDEAAFEHNETLAQHRRETGAGAAPVDAATLADLQRELSNLRTMIEGRLSQLSWRDMAGTPSAKAAVQARLARLGLSPTQAGSMVDILPAQGEVEDYWQVVLQMLVSRLAVQESDALIERGGIVALLGATGVGKTTAIAKLAARCVLRHGKQSVALVSTDCYRIGGQEQLQTFARYLGVPFAVATDSRELHAALDQLTPRPLVLIDTAGMSQRDARLYEQYRMLVASGYDIDTYLVLAASAQFGALTETLQVFGERDLTGAILTKVDETASLGGALDALIESGLPLAYVSEGQQVPDDLAPAQARQLVAKAVQLAAEDVDAGSGGHSHSNSNNDAIGNPPGRRHTSAVV